MEEICRLSGTQGATFVAQRIDSNKAIIGLAYYRGDPSRLDRAPELAMGVDDCFQAVRAEQTKQNKK